MRSFYQLFNLMESDQRVRELLATQDSYNQKHWNHILSKLQTLDPLEEKSIINAINKKSGVWYPEKLKPSNGNKAQLFTNLLYLCDECEEKPTTYPILSYADLMYLAEANPVIKEFLKQNIKDITVTNQCIITKYNPKYDLNDDDQELFIQINTVDFFPTDIEINKINPIQENMFIFFAIDYTIHHEETEILKASKNVLWYIFESEFKKSIKIKNYHITKMIKTNHYNVEVEITTSDSNHEVDWRPDSSVPEDYYAL